MSFCCSELLICSVLRLAQIFCARFVLVWFFFFLWVLLPVSLRHLDFSKNSLLSLSSAERRKLVKATADVCDVSLKLHRNRLQKSQLSCCQCLREKAAGRVWGSCMCTARRARQDVHGQMFMDRRAQPDVHNQTCSAKRAQLDVHSLPRTARRAQPPVHNQTCTAKRAQPDVHCETCIAKHAHPDVHSQITDRLNGNQMV